MFAGLAKFLKFTCVAFLSIIVSTSCNNLGLNDNVKNNLDLKYSSNKNFIEISDINSDIIFDKGNLSKFDLTGSLFNLPFVSTFQGSRNKNKSIGTLSINSNDLKFYFDADLTDINFLKNDGICLVISFGLII